MKKLSAMFLILMFFASANLFAAVKVTIVAPHVKSGYSGENTINSALDSAAASFETKLETSDLKKLGSQDKLSGAFANTTAYSAQSSSFTGYQGYDLFALMYGMSVAIQAPSLSASAAGDVGDDIKKDQDTNFGIGISNAFNLGLNVSLLKDMAGLSDILPNRMYMNIKYFNISQKVSDFSFDATTFGLGLNYQLVDNGGGRWNLIKWTGVSVGTGFLYNSNKIDMNYKLEDYESDLVSGNIKMVITPDTNFGIETSSYTIPFDVSTSARLLWMFNLTLGAGLDFNFGQSEIVAKSEGGVKVLDGSTDITSPTSTGSYLIDGGTTAEPTLANLRLTAGLGICFGPVPLDFSLTYYPITTGAALNISTGIVW